MSGRRSTKADGGYALSLGDRILVIQVLLTLNLGQLWLNIASLKHDRLGGSTPFVNGASLLTATILAVVASTILNQPPIDLETLRRHAEHLKPARELGRFGGVVVVLLFLIGPFLFIRHCGENFAVAGALLLTGPAAGATLALVIAFRASSLIRRALGPELGLCVVGKIWGHLGMGWAVFCFVWVVVSWWARSFRL
jgi:hypothetical protein